MLPVKSQHRKWANLQKHWMADATRDMKYNLTRARQERKAGNTVLARGYTQEYLSDRLWVGKRGRILKREQRLGR